MSRFAKILFSGGYVLVCLGGLSILSCDRQTKILISKPNFIIIFTDDQGYNDLGCYGAPLLRTPQIDQMAKEGLRFTNFYAQPICGPSRTALLTGCYPLRVAELDNIKRIHPSVHPKELLLPEILKQEGYKTGCIGKWDLNRANFDRIDARPNRQGFDYWFGMPSSNDGGVRKVFRNEEILKHTYTVDTLTQLYTAEALRFIENYKNDSFFLYLSHSMPHTKLGASRRFKGKSQFGLYGDVIEELDWSVGEIKKKVIELGLADKTLIVYTSDNGPWRVRDTHAGSAFPLRGGKISTWEGGVRVPCVVWGGNFLKQGVVDQVTSTMDLFPTFARLAGAKLPEGLVIDGSDISSLLVDNQPSRQLNQIYYYYVYTHLQAVRKGNWKLVLPRPQAPNWIPDVSEKSIWIREDMEPVRDTELYNLANDPSERRNVAWQHPEIVDELTMLADTARSEIGDYDRIGSGARFYDSGELRPEVKKWQAKPKDSLDHEIKVHPFYDDGSRVL